MTGTKREYERFLVWLATRQGVSGDVRRIANLIHAHFTAIARTSAAQAQRSRVLVPRLLRDLDVTADVLPELNEEAPKGVANFLRLRSLEVGPFRGFQRQEQFDLDARIVLFYGPNGTGKTSLCEALEFALLGEVAEAGSKRIVQEAYLRNVFVDAYTRPRLMGSAGDGQEVEITASSDVFRFCFIEKNRIDAFSRIAARPSAQRLELIATLFGLDGFTDFVRGFNQEIDGQLVLTARNRVLLDQRRAELEAGRAFVASAGDHELVFAAEELALAQEYAPELTFADLLRLLGALDGPGRLQNIEQALLDPPLSESGITRAGMAGAREDAMVQAARVDALKVSLDSRRGDLSFIALFEAVRDLGVRDVDHCPACDTPLSSVVKDPFQKAHTGLAELADLAALQREYGAAMREQQPLSMVLLERLRQVVAFTKDSAGDEQAMSALADVPPEPQGRWWEALDLLTETDSASTKWQSLELAAREAETLDVEVSQRNSERVRLIAERDRLNDFNLRVARQQTRREEHAQRFAESRVRIRIFDEESRPLIQEVEAERVRIEHHVRVQSAYNEFLALIRSYRAGLPAALMADLNETVRQLYNEFNRSDPQGDTLAILSLPLDETQRIEVAFDSHPGMLVDALQVMSEGHIRCLGLAILVAKNLNLDCPFLIFDDAVNAIDNEHRLGIRDTLFASGRFDGKQILITCHGEELIKDIEVVIGRIAANESCRSYTFLPHEGDRNIRVVSSSTRNYVLEAQQYFAAGRFRDAIASARRAMESINDRAWGLLVRMGQGELKLKVAKPRAPLDQNNLSTAIKQALERDAFVDPRKTQLVAGYVYMLQPREWSIFSVLTHEGAGLEDPPRETVRGVIENLVGLDDLLSNRSRAARVQ